ncbi:hypothetical protein OG21DRAFT_1487080 [Imleria badia]|nr:hypothetical protein OG21DRAFT_1487080 [Imleria badia]
MATSIVGIVADRFGYDTYWDDTGIYDDYRYSKYSLASKRFSAASKASRASQSSSKARANVPLMPLPSMDASRPGIGNDGTNGHPRLSFESLSSSISPSSPFACPSFTRSASDESTHETSILDAKRQQHDAPTHTPMHNVLFDTRPETTSQHVDRRGVARSGKATDDVVHAVPVRFEREHGAILFSLDPFPAVPVPGPEEPVMKVQGAAPLCNTLMARRAPLPLVLQSSNEDCAPNSTAVLPLQPYHLMGKPGADHEQLCPLNLEMQRVVTNIRELPGLSRFLLPSLFPDLQRAAAAANGGPVIIVNASKYSCDALIIFLDRDRVHISCRLLRKMYESCQPGSIS